MSRIYAIDPGPEKSAYVVIDTSKPGEIQEFGKVDNHEMLDLLKVENKDSLLVIEAIASYGAAVSQSIFGTCIWTGRFMQRWKDLGGWTFLIYRREVVKHLLGKGSIKGADARIRAKMIERFGTDTQHAIGSKGNPGPLYGVSSDTWQALGLAITAVESTIIWGEDGNAREP